MLDVDSHPSPHPQDWATVDNELRGKLSQASGAGEMAGIIEGWVQDQQQVLRNTVTYGGGVTFDEDGEVDEEATARRDREAEEKNRAHRAKKEAVRVGRSRLVSTILDLDLAPRLLVEIASLCTPNKKDRSTHEGEDPKCCLSHTSNRPRHKHPPPQSPARRR